jgi:predicted nucleic-acid-binding protein
MTEEELKQVVENLLEMQNNNDYNFQLLQAKIDALELQIKEMSNFSKYLSAPSKSQPFEVINP